VPDLEERLVKEESADAQDQEERLVAKENKEDQDQARSSSSLLSAKFTNLKKC